MIQDESSRALDRQPVPNEPRLHAAGVIEGGLLTRADVRVLPETLDRERRTIEVVWSQGATVRGHDPWTGKRYDEVLSLEPGHVDLARLNAGAPLLDTHGAFELASILGVVERAWIAKGASGPQGRTLVRFTSGQRVLVGALFGIATMDAAAGEEVDILTQGVVEIGKTSALQIDVGDRVFWDATNKVVNKTAAAQVAVGIAVVQALNPSATVRIRLGGGTPAGT